jgi:hypothetical protein
MEKNMLATASYEQLLAALQRPADLPSFKDWRSVLKKSDKHFLSKSDCSAAFKAAKVPEFP